MEKLRRNWFFYSSSIRKYRGGKVSGGATEQKMYTHKSEKSPRHLQPERVNQATRGNTPCCCRVSARETLCAVVATEIHICVINSTCPLIVKVKNGYARAKWFFRCLRPAAPANRFVCAQIIFKCKYLGLRASRFTLGIHTNTSRGLKTLGAGRAHIPLPLFGWRSRHEHLEHGAERDPNSMKNDDSRH